MNRLILTDCTDPYHNLALEELLLESHTEDVCLYLWQNQNTVVIGRNQNAWKECRIEELERDGGRLARRSSGGGAVFHDLGNLNFTFVTTKAGYDLPRQLGVITRALNDLGIEASFTGRNDIVSKSGAKLSGNAFRYTQTASMHHGTVLVGADMDKLGRYLMPSRAKLAAKGVDSVRSRVGNLRDYVPGITIAQVRDAISRSFKEEYGEYYMLEEKGLDMAALAEKQQRYSSWEWNKGSTPPFDLALEHRFPWGGIELQISLMEGRIHSLHAYSDAMDEAMILRLPGILNGLRLDPRELSEAVAGLGGEQAGDMAAWLREIEV